MPNPLTALRRAGFSLGLLLGLTMTGASAQDLHPFADPSRLVVIGGSLTEIVYALGEEDKLVARDSTAVYPEAALSLPDVGYMRALAPEGVLSVDPTALLVLEGSGPPQALEVLSEAGVEYQTIADEHSHQGILAKVRAVGQVLGVPAKAEALATELDAALTAVEQQTASVPERRRVLFVLSAQDGKLMVSGTGTAANGAIALAGAVNAVTEFEGYKPLTDEAIIAAAPDAVLMMDNAGGHSLTPEELFGHPGLAATPAGQTHTLIHMDGAYLLGFGPRTAAAVAELAKSLYGAPQ